MFAERRDPQLTQKISEGARRRRAYRCSLHQQQVVDALFAFVVDGNGAEV
jgi:hypothetical protein